jgi:TetR/AcrR family transcriptional regulator
MSERTDELTRDKELLILNAAQRRFAVYGLSKVTMDEIAADLGMGKTSLYYYFPTKEDLFRRVIQREQQEFLLRVRAHPELPVSVAEKLKQYAQQRLKYSSELANLHLFSLQGLLFSKPQFHELFEGFAAEEQRYLCDLFRQGAQSGEFDLQSPEILATVVLHLLQGLQMRAHKRVQLTGEQSAAAEELARDMIMTIELVLAGIRKA